MKTIYKYKLAIRDVADVAMPIGAKVLCVQKQHEDICLWAEVDTEKSLERRQFYVCGTGNLIPPYRGRYVGTVQDDRFVWHIYEAVSA